MLWKTAVILHEY